MATEGDLEGLIERIIIAGVALTAGALGAAARELTLFQWRVLVVVGEAGTDGVHVGEVARRIGVSAPSGSRVLRRLEDQGLILTQRDEDDRRRSWVRLTPAGAGLRRDIMTHRRASIRDALAASPAELGAETRAALDAIATALETRT